MAGEDMGREGEEMGDETRWERRRTEEQIKQAERGDRARSGRKEQDTAGRGRAGRDVIGQDRPDGTRHGRTG